MPNLTVEILEGRSLDQKRELVKYLTAAVCETLHVEPQRVRIRIVDVATDQLARGGVLRIDQQEP